MTTVLRIEHDSGATPQMQRLLERASKLIDEGTAVSRERDGVMRLRCPLPAGYKPGMNHCAKELQARVHSGRLFEISEVSDGVSGGWMASCIPPSLYRIFLNAWIAHANQPRQLNLFALETA